MSAHHPLGPSSLSRRAACPGSYHAELPLWDTPQESSDEAAAGTARHAAAAAGLQDPARRPVLLADLPADDRPLVESWWTYWDKSIVRQHGTEVIGGVETPVQLTGERFGSCDAWLSFINMDGCEILIVGDLKGTPPGRARYNLQIADYARGLINAHGLGQHGRDLAVIVAIVSRAGVDEHQYDPAEFAARCDEIDRIIAAAKAESAPRIPGIACTYCRAADTCEARTAVVIQASAITDPVAAIASLEPSQRTDLLDRLSMAAKRLSETEKAIRERIKDGSLEVPGYRYFPSTSKTWRDALEARAAIIAMCSDRGIDPAELMPLVSASQAAGILGTDSIEPLTERRQAAGSVRRIKGAA